MLSADRQTWLQLVSLNGLKRLAVVAVAAICSNAAAQTVAPSGWQLEVTPYLFASAMKNDGLVLGLGIKF